MTYTKLTADDAREMSFAGIRTKCALVDTFYDKEMEKVLSQIEGAANAGKFLVCISFKQQTGYSGDQLDYFMKKMTDDLTSRGFLVILNCVIGSSGIETEIRWN